MATGIKVIIVDNDKPFVTALESALRHGLQDKYSGIDIKRCIPDGPAFTIETLIKEFTPQNNEPSTPPALFLINANLTVGRNDKYSDWRGWELAKEIRQSHELINIAVVLYSLDKLEQVLKKEPESDRRYIIDVQDADIILPCNLPEVCEKLASAKKSFEAKRLSDKLRLALTLLDNKIEVGNKHFRHTYFSEKCLASVRLLLGAMQDGDVELAKARSVLEQLSKKNGQTATDYKTNLDAIVSLLNRRKKLIEELNNSERSSEKAQTQQKNGKWAPQCKTLTKNHPEAHSGKLLIVDDELETAGWKEVYECMFTSPRFNYKKEKIVGKTSWQEAPNLIDPKSEPFDFVLLDLHLGRDKATGFDALLQIKQQQFDLPVIMVTGFESAQIAKACYKHGAFDYFVKERSERTDRSSLNYYSKFAEIINRVPPASDPVRQLWKEFTNIEHSIDMLIKNKSNAKVKNPSKLIRKAFFVLFADTANVRTQCLYKDRYTEAADNINEVALELHRQWYCNLNGSYCDIAREEGLFAWLQEKFKDIAARDAEISTAKKAIHNPRTEIDLVKNQTKSAMKALFEIARAYMKECGITEQGYSSAGRGLNHTVTDTIDTIRSSLKKTSTLDHRQRAYEGAEKLLIGYLLEKGVSYNSIKDVINEHQHTSIPERLNGIKKAFEKNFPRSFSKKYRCLYVDDDGRNSGWKRFFELALPDIETEYHEFTHRDGEIDFLVRKIRLMKKDFVLLDLFLPSSPGECPIGDTGLAILKAIKQANFSMPVIMLTASDDSFWVRKCFNAGADDYFPKYGLIMEVERKEERFYRDCYTNFQKAINHITQDLIQGKQVHSYWAKIKKLRAVIDEIVHLCNGEHCRGGKELLENLKAAKNICLDNMYFFYTADMDILNYSRLFHLLRGSENFYKEVFLNYGAVVEHLFKLLYFCDNQGARKEIIIPRTVHKIASALWEKKNSKLTTLVDKGCKVWEERNNVIRRDNMGVTDDKCLETLGSTVEFFVSAKEYLESRIKTKIPDGSSGK